MRNSPVDPLIYRLEHLIAASRNDQPNSEGALRLLASNRRRFLTSVFVRLEVFPTVAYHGFSLQRAMTQEFFMDPTLEWAPDLNAIVRVGTELAETYNTSPLDSLHLAAAILLRADEFATTEKPGRAMYRVPDLNVCFLDNMDLQ